MHLNSTCTATELLEGWIPGVSRGPFVEMRVGRVLLVLFPYSY